ncbi:MAG: hypothetical protein ACFFD2_04795 [Promethearchaeota archaeon]
MKLGELKFAIKAISTILKIDEILATKLIVSERHAEIPGMGIKLSPLSLKPNPIT